jgi:hypothetical protein
VIFNTMKIRDKLFEASKLEHEGPGTSSAVALLVILRDFTNLR